MEGIIKRKAKMEKKEEKKEQIEEKEEKIGLKEEDIQEIDAIVKMRMDMFRERMKKRLCEVLG